MTRMVIEKKKREVGLDRLQRSETQRVVGDKPKSRKGADYGRIFE